MKTTGIVRRVDDLGRIVIPREYRRAFDINIGDPMEIIADDGGNIVLKRVDTTGEFKKISESVAAFLSEQFGWTVIVSDKLKYVLGYGRKKGELIDRPLPSGVASIVGGAHKTTVEVSALSQSDTDMTPFSKAYVEPIICPSGVLGALFVLPENLLNEQESKIITLSARLIGNNMQKY